MRSVARILGATALGVALLAWLTRGVDWTRLGDSVRPVPWWTWGAAALGLAASYVLRALRIQAELGRRRRLGLRACLEVMLVHNAAVNVLPMRGGEAAYPWLLHRRLAVPVAEAVASLVWMRVQDVIILSFLAAALWPGVALLVRIGAAAGLAAVVLGALRLLARAAATRRPAPPHGPARAARGALEALALAPRHGWRGWVFCAGSWSVKLLALGGLLAALSGLAPREGITGGLGGELAGVLPVQGPAGLGTYEAGVWAGAALRGRTAAEIAAPALAVHLLSFSTAIAAGLLGHLLSGGFAGRSPFRGRVRDASPPEPPSAPAQPHPAAPPRRTSSNASFLEHDHG
jgi:uncharacterized membrane protein YbhN (UPF0104 family)